MNQAIRWRKANPERRKQHDKLYYQRHRKKLLAYSKAYYWNFKGWLPKAEDIRK